MLETHDTVASTFILNQLEPTDRLIADICYFVEEEKVSRSVQNKTYDLCERLEYARQTGDGLLDI